MFNATFDLASLNGENGFTATGGATGEQSGISVSNVGDVNGDGIDDVIIGANTAAPGGRSNAGSSYVVFGKNTQFNPVLELSALDGSNGFVINGVESTDNSGYSVSHAGDINGDGISDLIIGAFNASPGGRLSAGSSYVVFGKNTPFNAILELSTLDGNNGFVINGVTGLDAIGTSVSGANDINGDGIDDVIIGAPGASPGGSTNSGSSYVVFGRNTGFSATLELSTLDGSNGFTINGIASFDQSGSAVSGANDVNGDGIDDVIISGSNADPGNRTNAGSAYVVFGKNTGFNAVLELSTLDGNNGFVMNGVASSDQAGSSVGRAGDINDDGIADVIIGAPNASPSGRVDAGSAYVVFGKNTGFNAVLELSALDGNNGFVINGVANGDVSGSPVTNAGDINDDGISDVVIGAPGASPGGSTNSGSSYVVFGRNTGFSAVLELSTLNGTDGFALIGAPAGSNSGTVSYAGDLNGDNSADIIIGAPNADPDGRINAGLSYVVFGQPPRGRNSVSAASGLESTLDNVLFGLGAGFFAHRSELFTQNILGNNAIVIPMLQNK